MLSGSVVVNRKCLIGVKRKYENDNLLWGCTLTLTLCRPECGIYVHTNKFMNMMEKGITRETIKGDYMKTQMFTEYVSSVS